MNYKAYSVGFDHGTEHVGIVISNVATMDEAERIGRALLTALGFELKPGHTMQRYTDQDTGFFAKMYPTFMVVTMRDGQ